MAIDDELLDAICAAPERDEPRLAYARWLDDHGDPRGEFIGASCTPGEEVRAEELLAVHRERWTSVLGDLAIELSHPPRFERGFIIELYLMGTFGELLLDFAPTVIAMRPVPVALILGAERIQLRPDMRAYAWHARADNELVVFSLPEYQVLARVPPTSATVQMLGFVGDMLHYLVGSERRTLPFDPPPGLPSAR